MSLVVGTHQRPLPPTRARKRAACMQEGRTGTLPLAKSAARRPVTGTHQQPTLVVGPPAASNKHAVTPQCGTDCLVQ